MCNIYWLEPKQMPTKEQVYNSVYNNWHSMGAVIRHHGEHKDGGDRLEVIHHIPKSGEVDPKMVYELMGDNLDKQRIIHVRHNTAGQTDLSNCHPFKVFESEDDEIYFMHNGTLYTYKEMLNGVEVKDGPSDSLNFANMILKPLFSRLKDPDINNQLTQKIINKFWTTNNRGILISRQSEKPVLIDLQANPWKKVQGESSEFISSNNDYFSEVKRGPEFDRREAAKKAEEEKKKSNVVKLSDFSKKERHGFFRLSTSPVNVLNDWEVYDRPHATAMGYLTRPELRAALEADKEGFLDLVEWIFADYASLFQEHEEAEGKLERATKIIATLKAGKKEEKNVESVSATEEQSELPEAEVRVG